MTDVSAIIQGLAHADRVVPCTAEVPATSDLQIVGGQFGYLSVPGRSDEVLDGCLNFTGDRLVTASTSCTAIECSVMAGTGNVSSLGERV